jgi:hypothetical protein
MRAFVPRVHAVQQRVTLMNDPNWRFNAWRQMRARDDHGDFQQTFFFRV